MEDNNDEIIKKNLELSQQLQNFKEQISLHSHKNTERELIVFKRAIKFNEELADNENEEDIMYLNGRIIYFNNLFNAYFVENNRIDQVS